MTAGAASAASVRCDARLALVGDLDESPLMPGSWFVTFGEGKPARGTFTEIAFDPRVVITDPMIRDAVLEEAARRVAVDLYGTAWAFLYRPEQYGDAIARWQLRRRERVLVTRIEVW